jgi:hypothetical protein
MQIPFYELLDILGYEENNLMAMLYSEQLKFKSLTRTDYFSLTHIKPRDIFTNVITMAHFQVQKSGFSLNSQSSRLYTFNEK